jgi:hypothetical protein
MNFVVQFGLRHRARCLSRDHGEVRLSDAASRTQNSTPLLTVWPSKLA